jgi:hypothetical protein
MKGGISPDTLANLRAAYREFEKVSKRGDTAFVMTHQVIDALGAPKEEFHDRIAQLPISIEVSNVGLREGREHTRRDYFVSGKLRFSVFVSVSAADKLDSPAQPSSEWSEPGEEIEELSANLSLSTYCEYTDPVTQEFFSGDCATQQEIDDGLAAIAAMDSEIEAALIEQEEVHAEYCEAILMEIDPEEPEEDEIGCDPSNNAAMQAKQSLQEGPMTGAMSDEESLEGLQPVSTSDHGVLAVRGECAAQAIFGSIAVITWIGAKYGAVAVMTTAGLPASAVPWAVFGALTTGAAAAYGVATYIQCMQEHS